MNISVRPYRLVKTVPLAFMLMTPCLSANAVNMNKKQDTYEAVPKFDENSKIASETGSKQMLRTVTAAALLIIGMGGIAHILNKSSNNSNKKNEG